MKLKDLARELQQYCEEGYADCDVEFDTRISAISTGFEYRMKSSMMCYSLSKQDNKVGFCLNHCLELDDERHRAYENVVNFQKKCDKIESELLELAEQVKNTESNINDLLRKKKLWWKL